jgi:hypothetical protein
VSASTLSPFGEGCTAAIDISATEAAISNARANLLALSSSQPRLAGTIQPPEAELTPVYARDGSLTVFGPDARWWHGCSVPVAAAEAMLSSLDVTGRVACLLAPTLAAHVRVALRRSRSDQAVIAVCPEIVDLQVLVACDDFTEDIRARRLWFVGGDDWAVELGRLFAERPGLATPAQFIRLPVTPAERVERLVPAAQAVFAETNASRAAQLAARRGAWRRAGAPKPRVCVVAPSQFRLWNDAGATLAEALEADAGGAEIVAFDPDDPMRSSAVALLDAAESCSVVVAADTFRADLPGVLPDAMPWITWTTRAAGIRPFAGAEAGDAIIVADRAGHRRAVELGWPRARIATGDWPLIPAMPLDTALVAAVAIVADTQPVVMPVVLEEFSSHQLLWNDILRELQNDPFAALGDPVAYLERRMQRGGVSAEGFDVTAFVESLILPAYAQGIVRILMSAGVPVRLYGAGWRQIGEFADAAQGPIRSRGDLARVREYAAAVVDVHPVEGTHPLHRVGLLVLRPDARGRGQFIDAAQNALRARRDAPRPTAPLSMGQVVALIPK